ncbi:MAG: S1 family peptidase [Actinophytocola sp.]|uniref:S1 family peptidase n=1 Tax=Actinophytocola sp. TaxID=1872138 RepID=UPI003C78F833
MKRSRTARLCAALAISASLTVAGISSATASDKTAPTSPVNAPKITQAMSDAMQRDLGLSANQVKTRLAQEEAARNTETDVRAALGDSYAGSWFDAKSGTLVVQTTERAKALGLGKGVTVHVVSHSRAELDGIKMGIDRFAGKSAPSAINGWTVDDRTNSVVVAVNSKKIDAAANTFLSSVKAMHSSIRVVEESSSPATYADVVGGWPYWINYAGRCSVGFAVYGGFVSAGHCGTPGSTASDQNGALLGTFAGSQFPGNDFSYISAAAGVNLWGYVEGYDGYWYYVYGSAQVPQGSGICRSGSTTGMWCGTLLDRGWTVNYPQGTVYNLTRTNVCAEPGDSGGSWLSANQAQGVTSGGSGNCSSGGTTYYQEVNPILATYGLTLITSP